jgi:TetR/AcrR family transcriptional regulator
MSSNPVVTCAVFMDARRKNIVVPRNPERTQERILAAALKEFSAHGFAGARVDLIARRAAINKRMLYHYFGNKEDLFRAVLRRKIAERQAWAAASPDDPAESLPAWFDLACKDVDWIRLLEWEALRGGEKPVIDEAERRAAAERAVERIRRRQAGGHLSDEFDPRHVLLAMIGLTAYPVAFPQLTRLITGKQVTDPAFQRERRAFLRKFSSALSPSKKEMK